MTNLKTKRGTNKKQPSEIRLSGKKSITAWEQSLEAQLKHLKSIKEEAEKAAKFNGHKSKVKITKRFELFYQEEIALARIRNKRKRGRK